MNEDEARKRYIDQRNKRAKRSYPAGRMGAEDDGELAVAVGADKVHKKVIMDFGKSVSWIAWDEETLNGAINVLLQKAREAGMTITIDI